MNLQNFLQKIQNNPKEIRSYPVIYFFGQTYPTLFFSLLFSYLKKHTISPTHLDMQANSSEQIKAQVQTSFLGNSVLFMLRGYADLSAAEKREWMTFFDNYQGPHTLITYVSSLEKKQMGLTVELPEKVDLQLLALLSALNDSKVLVKNIEQYLFTRSLTLDEACMLLHYLTLAGKNTKRFFDEWFDRIINPTTSLFSLSKYFFAKKANAFFREWTHIHTRYPEQFWVSFWSEQLYRASLYVQYKKEQKGAEAKRVSYKLPFSFIQYDWKKHSYHSLSQAHERVYTIDYRLKHGSAAPALDLFYAGFFEGSFNSFQSLFPAE